MKTMKVLLKFKSIQTKKTPCLQNIFKHSRNQQVQGSKVQCKANIQAIFILQLSINDDDEFNNFTTFEILVENQAVVFCTSQC